MITLHIGGRKYKLSFGLGLDVRVSPPSGTILGISFKKGPTHMGLLGTIQLSPATPDVTSRPVTITLDGGVPFVVDYIDPAATFPCQEGQNGVATYGDVNAAGSAPVSDPFSFACTLGVVLPEVPPKGSILAVHFEQDPANP